MNNSEITEQLLSICAALNCTVSFNDSKEENEFLLPADAAWQLRSAFVILTLQSGFALLEAGFVNKKNLANVMAKNTVDVGIGGMMYWLIGYGLSFGDGGPFAGVNHFGTGSCSNFPLSGSRCTQYMLQFTFASTANTILSGAVAERMNLMAYSTFSALNEISYCLPVRWAWSDGAWLKKMGFYDLAGSCVVHVNGGISALVATMMVGPRMRRWEKSEAFGLGSPVTALTGTLLLWWGWFSFNCSVGSSGNLWKTNALIAVNTFNSSVGGTCIAFLVSVISKKGVVDVAWLIDGILGGLVSITGCASVVSTFESLVIGAVGGLIAIGTGELLQALKVDDPVGAVPVHFFAALWGTLSVGIFGKDDEYETLGADGLVHGGGFKLLGAQMLGALAISGWSAATTLIFMLLIDFAIGLRLTPENEERGADECEHDIKNVDGLRGIVATKNDSGSETDVPKRSRRRRRRKRMDSSSSSTDLDDKIESFWMERHKRQAVVIGLKMGVTRAVGQIPSSSRKLRRETIVY